MSQVSRCLRKIENGYSCWCPACKEMHILFDSWQFDGNLEKPTFSPSFKIEGVKTVRDENGVWTGGWELDAQGKPIPEVCHFILTNGILHFCSDCTHDMRNMSVPIPDLPEYYRDKDFKS